VSFTPHEIALLKSSRLFDGLAGTPRFAELLARPESRLQVAENACFLERGDRSPGLHILVHGSVELFFCNAEGEEKVLHFIKSGETLAEETVSDGRPINYWARTLTPTVMLRIPSADILGLMDESWPFAERFLRLVSERICLLYADVVTFYSKTAVQRLACYLICGFETSRLTLKDSLNLSIPVPKKNLASRLSISQTHLSRALRDLTERGLISQDGNRLQVVNVEGLAEYVCPHGCDL